MITVITGTPGAGKTALAVDLLIKEYSDRPLYVDNLNGLILEHHEIDVMEWHNEVPDGALIICDEIQRKWRPRGPGSKVPESIAALETHRHRGIDFILITQNVKLIDSNVRALVGRHLHIRDTGWMGRWLYEFPECDTNNSWKRCENKRRYKLPKHVFDKYKSASLHTKPVRTRPILLYFVIAAVLAFIYLAWSLYQSFQTQDLPTQQNQSTSPTLIQSGVSSMLPDLQPKAETQKKIDDRVDWTPRVTTYPESAPVYDSVRQIKTFPKVAGGVCMRGVCKCFTQQGSNAGLSSDQCLYEINNPRFDAYADPQAVQAQARVQKAPESDDSSVPKDDPEIKRAVALRAYEDQLAVTKAAKTAALISQ